MELLHLEGGAFPVPRVEVVMYSLATLINFIFYQGNCPQHDVLPDYSGQRCARLPDTSVRRRSMHGLIARGGIALFHFNFGCILVLSKREQSTEFIESIECASGFYKECESEAGYAVIVPKPL